MSLLLAGVVFGGSAMAAEATNSGAIALQDSFIVLVPRPAHLTAENSSVPSHFDDRVGESMRSFLWQIVADAARDDAVLVFTGELRGIGTGMQVRRTIGIAFKGDRGNANERTCGKLLFQFVILRLTCSETKAPAVVVDHDADVIRVVE